MTTSLFSSIPFFLTTAFDLEISRALERWRERHHLSVPIFTLRTLAISFSFSQENMWTQRRLWEEGETQPATFRRIPGFVCIERSLFSGRILVMNWKRSSSQYGGIGQAGLQLKGGSSEGVTERVNRRGWGGAPCWVVGFCATCKGSALFSVNAEPAHCCIHARISQIGTATQQAHNGLPTDDTQNTEVTHAAHRDAALLHIICGRAATALKWDTLFSWFLDRSPLSVWPGWKPHEGCLLWLNV